MPLDFPNSPTNGQIFSSGTKKWTWSAAEGSWLASNVTPDSAITSLSSTIDNKFIVKPASASAQQVLTYNDSTATWVASAAPTGGGTGTATYKLPRYRVTFDTGLIIKNDREIKIWGYCNSMFQGRNNASSPLNVPFFGGYLSNNPTVTIVDAIITSSAVMTLLSDGTVWVLGPNEQTLQGRGGTSVPNSTMCFNQVPGLANIIKIDITTDENTNTRNCGALTSSGNLYMWGSNTFGSCGVGTPAGTAVNTPTIALTNVSDFALLNEETVGLSIAKKIDNTLWAAGYNANGQLGTGNKTNQTSFIQCRTGPTTFVSNVANLQFTSWIETRNLMYIDASGNVWAAGDNSNGQLLDGSTIESLYFKQIISGKNATKLHVENRNYAIVCSNGELYTWGENSRGCLGIGLASGTSRYNSITLAATNVKDFRWTGYEGAVTIVQSTIIKNDGTVWSAGANVAAPHSGFTGWGDYSTTTFVQYDVSNIGYLSGTMYNWGTGGLSQVWLSSNSAKIYILYPYNGADAADAGFTLGCGVWLTPTDVTEKF